MVRINKVYTKTGDKGETGLVGGQRVSKASPRIEAYGGVDELNATLGLVAEFLRTESLLDALRGRVLRVQNELFDLGAQMATPEDKRNPQAPSVTPDDIARLENEIDEMNTDLPALTSFVLPGGGMIGAHLHLARTVCRRVERNSIRAGDTLGWQDEVAYLNRLSDWLFVASRYVASKLSIEETLWLPGNRD